MRQREVDFGTTVPIDGYGNGGFRVGGKVHRGPLALIGRVLPQWRGFGDVRPFLAEAERIDVLLVGMGATIAAPGPDLKTAIGELEAAGIGVETMATPSACRTYNVLLAEGRRIAAALLPI